MNVAEPLMAGEMTPATFRVRARSQDTADTFTLTLAPRQVVPPAVAPGQFMMVYAFGIGEVPISVSGTSPAGEVILTVRAVGAVTRAICSSAVGSALGMRGPFGVGWPIAGATGADVVVIAGGIGLAPLRMLIQHVMRDREAFSAFSVLYGARTPEDLLYAAEFDGWRSAAEVAVTVDAAGRGWRGRIGVVPKLVGAATFHGETTHAFVCGPEVMMSFTIQALLERGVTPGRIHLSMERHMDCGIGLCGHCQLGPTLICRDGPVYAYSEVGRWMGVRQL